MVLYVLTPADSKRVYSRRIFIVMDIISSNFVVEGYLAVIGFSVCNLLIVMQFGFTCAVIIAKRRMLSVVWVRCYTNGLDCVIRYFLAIFNWHSCPYEKDGIPAYYVVNTFLNWFNRVQLTIIQLFNLARRCSDWHLVLQ